MFNIDHQEEKVSLGKAEGTCSGVEKSESAEKFFFLSKLEINLKVFAVLKQRKYIFDSLTIHDPRFWTFSQLLFKLMQIYDIELPDFL